MHNKTKVKAHLHTGFLIRKEGPDNVNNFTKGFTHVLNF